MFVVLTTCHFLITPGYLLQQWMIRILPFFIWSVIQDFFGGLKCTGLAKNSELNLYGKKIVLEENDAKFYKSTLSCSKMHSTYGSNQAQSNSSTHCN
jgi:hypothetical protein